MTEVTNIHDQFSHVYDNLLEMSKTCKSLLEEVKKVQKQYKVVERKSKDKKKRPQVKLTLSSELSKFLNISDELTKAETMKLISNYIKENNLQAPENKRKFVPNKALMKLFKLKILILIS